MLSTMYITSTSSSLSIIMTHCLAGSSIHAHSHMKMTPLSTNSHACNSDVFNPTGPQQVIMEPEDNHPGRSAKETVSPINRQINRYRNALPEVPREEGHFFFKDVTRQIEEITYVSIGYRIGNIPFELQDIVAVIINNIHYASEVNLKLILDRDTLWVTGAIGIPSEEVNSLRYRIEEAHLNESLLKTQRIVAQFLQEIRNNPRREDKVVLEKLNKEIIKQIQLVFKNPDLED